jgi:5-methylcytosine-specific restriction enzyme A
MGNDWRALNRTHPEVEKMSHLLRQTPIHPGADADQSFRNRNSVHRKSGDIASQHPDSSSTRTKGNALDRVVLQDFLEAPEHMHQVALALHSLLTAKGKKAVGVAKTQINGELEAKEGTLLVKRHVSRERDPTLRAAKINQLKHEAGRVQCEVCRFDFGAT